ncbi:hypothetical protein PM10SUCC1_02440 [Propionigenium maris DSM 9537]|uniref:Uncharacterized protein n=1 Tax=Propionigenium maris DSM 9537 TaxID=1123000 RepID=A0A9W6GGA7_9FUSO|nr:hypothetical protein [Propionigenium maris]GLI54729.1 hypothetical protein PM10SUCC1_02440 [Propionigenium maris DSM 9537]
MSVNQKYTIGSVQQDKLIEFGLDIKDAFILDYIREVSRLKNVVRKVVDGRTYIWLDYNKMINYLPILSINNKEVIGRRFKKYGDLKLVSRHLHKPFSSTGRTSGTYTFFSLEAKFNSLFEINTIEDSPEEKEAKLREMGLLPHPTEKSDEESTEKSSVHPTEKSDVNTPNNNTPNIDSSSTDSTKEEFISNLMTLLSKSAVRNFNTNTLKNITRFSGNDIKVVERAIAFMKLKNKSITPGVLVAILRDKDFRDAGSIASKEVKRDEKIEFMAGKLGEHEVRRLRGLILQEIGFECSGVDDQLGNILCRKFNQYIDEGGIYV